MKKFISVLLSAGMIISNISAAMAEENDVLYSYTDSNNNTINVTQDDIDSGRWDRSKLSDLPLELYEDFPAIVNSRIEDYSHLDLNISYLKNITLQDSIKLTVTNRVTNETIYDEILTQDTRDALVENMEVGVAYTVKIDETFGTENNIYTAVIDMQYEAAEMPENISITHADEGDGITLPQKVLVREIVDENNADEEYIPEEYLVNTEDFPALYNTLSSQKVYRVNASIIEDGEYVTYNGYVSKNSEYSQLGIFIPDYTFYMEDEYEALLNAPMTVSESTMPDWENWDYYDLDANKTKEIENYTDYFIRGTEWKLVKVKFIETGSYEFATFGNYQVEAVMWWYVNNDGEDDIDPNEDTLTYRVLNTSSTNKNIVRNLSALKKSEVFFLIRIDTSTATGAVADCVSTFRVRRTEEAYANDRENSMFNLDLAVKEADANNIPDSERTKNNSKILNEYIDESLEYKRDTDSYYIDTAENGYYSVSLTNNSNHTICFEVWSNYDDVVMSPDSDAITVLSEEIGQYNFRKTNENYEYYITVYHDKRYIPGTYPNNYTICAANQDFDDEYEGTTGNNTQANATDITNITSPLYGTISKGDYDWYKFTTGNAPYNITARVESMIDAPYYMYLYDDEGSIASGIRNTTLLKTTISDTRLEPNTTYYFKIYGSSSIYSSAVEYYFRWTLEELPVAAVLSEDVTVSISESDELTSLDTLLTPILEKLTCNVDGSAVSSADALADIKLYTTINNVKTELTADVVNELTAGDYAITVEYMDNEATGGTVTLIVSAAASTWVELSGLSMNAVAESWDWVECARIIANARLVREGSSPTTKSIANAIMTIQGAQNISVRADINKTAIAADYFYNNGANGDQPMFNFYNNTYLESAFEAAMLTEVQNGRAVILLLTSATAPTDYTLARYVVLCGVNTSTHEYKIMDPATYIISEVSHETLMNGGYNSNNDLRFSGTIIEFG